MVSLCINRRNQVGEDTVCPNRSIPLGSGVILGDVTHMNYPFDIVPLDIGSNPAGLQGVELGTQLNVLLAVWNHNQSKATRDGFRRGGA